MNNNEIYRIFGTDFKENTKRVLEAARLFEHIPDRDSVIGIKPNLVAPTPASYGATTHPEVVAGIVEYLRERDFNNIIITEGSWIGDKTSDAYEYCGYRELCEKYNVEFVDSQKDGHHCVSCGGVDLNICDVVDRIDFLINVPVLKGHCQTKITCALKNMKGLIPNTEKRRFHTMGLHKPIGHLSLGIRQDFIVVDHICGDLDFEEGGNPVIRNCIMAACDPVLVDAYVCNLFKLTPDDVPYVRYAEELGSGSCDLNNLVICDLNKSEFNEEFSFSNKILDVKYAVDEIDSCSACYASLIPALLQLKSEGLIDNPDFKIAIGQGHQNESGLIGVGRCCAGFDYYIKGCPPDEKDVYEGLKQYILNLK